ncbi:MAG: DUF559 domain-containing protein [Kofleriaceae bacterium]
MHGTPRVTVLVGGPQGREIWEQWVALSGLTGALLEGEVDPQVRAAVARAIADPTQPIAVRASAADAVAWRLGRSDRLAAMVDEGWIDVAEHDPDGREPRRQQAEPQHHSTPSASNHASAHAEGAAGRAGGAAGRADGAVGRAEGAAGRAEGAAGRADGAAGRADGAAGRAEGTAGRDGEVEGRRRRATHVDARSVAEATLFEALEATAATVGRFTLNESLSVRFGGAAAEVDLLSRGDGIAIEIDGVHHFADLEAYRRDRKKDLLLQSQGLFVVRVLADDVMRDVRAAVNAVCQALAYRRKERG